MQRWRLGACELAPSSEPTATPTPSVAPPLTQHMLVHLDMATAQRVSSHKDSQPCALLSSPSRRLVVGHGGPSILATPYFFLGRQCIPHGRQLWRRGRQMMASLGRRRCTTAKVKSTTTWTNTGFGEGNAVMIRSRDHNFRSIEVNNITWLRS